MESESIGHIQWSCPKAQEAWGYSKMVRRSNLEGGRTFQDLLWTLLMVDEVGDDQVAKVVTIGWALWHNRNEVRHDGEKKNGKSLVQWALNYIAKYNVVVVDASESISVVEQAVSWWPPHVNWY